MKRIPLAAVVLTILLACGSSSWAALLRGALVASPAFLSSLHLGDKQQAVANDFIELAKDTTVLADDIKACASDKPCALEAVNKFQTHFWDVLRHGNFKLHEKLQRVQDIVQGIIDSARIYFGAKNPSTATAGATSPSVSESDIKTQIETLKAVMKPSS